MGLGRPINVHQISETNIAVQDTKNYKQRKTSGVTLVTQHRRFMGCVLDHCELNLRAKKIRMEVDGSIRDERGGDGVVLKDGNNMITRITVPVDGLAHGETSYHAELTAIYADLKYLNAIIPEYEKKYWTGKIISDSESSLQKLFLTGNIIPRSIKQALELKFLLVSVIN